MFIIFIKNVNIILGNLLLQVVIYIKLYRHESLYQ